MHSEISVHAYGVCQEPADDATVIDFVDDAMRKLLPHSVGGGKVNDCDLTAFRKAFLSAPNAARLEELRGTYDPDGLFHPALGLEGGVGAPV